MSYTIIVVAITCIISAIAFNNVILYNKLILWPRYMDTPAEYHRLLTSGFIHADWMHLAFNMFTLWSFGTSLETTLAYVSHRELFIVIYLTGIITASLPSFLQNRNNSYYRSLGASGGVAAVLFATIYYHPWAKLLLFIIPMPSILFAVAYLVYSAYMSKRGADNVNHGAHFWGAVYGFAFAFVLDPTHGRLFIQQLKNLQ
ncbi:MAG: rhomboid family intramembrane serine protease [Bacteroidota bacterium]